MALPIPPEPKTRKAKKLMKEAHYICKCQTCDLIFTNMTLDEIHIAMKANKWLPRHQHWYIDAGHHWVDHPDHVINVLLDYGTGQTDIIRPLTQVWQNALKLEVDQSPEAMKNELKAMENGVS